MSANDHTQRRHRQRDDSRRGHPLQHRDRRRDRANQGDHGDQRDRRSQDHRDDQGWAERGTWANLDDETRGGHDSRHEDDHERHRRREGESFVRHVRESARQGSESTRHSDTAQGFGRSAQGNSQRRSQPDRGPGGGGGTPSSQSRGNPRTGSQRETNTGVGSSGQFADRHGPRMSASESAGYHGEEHFGGQKGGSSNDRRFGSRRGHGTGRRRDPRVRDQE